MISCHLFVVFVCLPTVVVTTMDRMLGWGGRGDYLWLAQSGGMTCLDDEGMAEISTLMDYYLENAKILKEVGFLSGILNDFMWGWSERKERRRGFVFLSCTREIQNVYFGIMRCMHIFV